MKNPSRITAPYDELREKVKAILDKGFKCQAFADLCGTPYSNVYDWALRGRPLSHENAAKVEQAINQLKAFFANI